LDGAALAADLAPHRYRIKAAAFAPYAQRFATYDDGGFVRLWSIDGKLLKEKRPRLLRHNYDRIAFAPGRDTLAVYVANDSPGLDGGFVLWHFGAEDRVEHRASQFLRFLPDGAVARQSQDLLVVDGPDGAERHFDVL